MEPGEGLLLGFSLLIGLVFGVLLEQAGFGNARKLVEQFYFKDMRMFKVLFSAIVTAMLGIYWLGYAGALDTSRIYINTTYVLPQAAGGILFGIGFVMCGLCPGTSCVAVFSGKLDGLAVFAGIFAGFVLYGETSPGMERWVNGTALGDVSLYELFHLSYGTVVFLVVIIALAAFWIVERVEKKTNPSA